MDSAERDAPHDGVAVRLPRHWKHGCIALMHRALVVTAKPAWPPVSGADLRSWQIASALAELGPVAVASVAPLAPASPPGGNIKVIGLTEAGESRRDAFRRKRTYIDDRIPETAVDRLPALSREFEPDAIVLEGIPLHPLLPLLRPLTGNLILDLHNVESDLAARLRATRMPTAQWLFRLLDRNPERIRKAEVAAVARVDRVWVCSPQDRERLHAAVGPVSAHIVPNGVPRCAAWSKPLAPPSRDCGPVTLFVGHLGYEPNVRAVERICREIAPLVRLRLPHSRFVVAGRHPKKALRRLAAAGAFELVADPPDVAQYLARAHVALVPVDIGGGTRLKILEAMAAGVPVVATPFATEGLDVVDGLHLLLARSAEDFAEAVERLWQDGDLGLRLGSAARTLVLERYGPSAISSAVRHGLGLSAPR